MHRLHILPLPLHQDLLPLDGLHGQASQVHQPCQLCVREICSLWQVLSQAQVGPPWLEKILCWLEMPGRHQPLQREYTCRDSLLCKVSLI